MIDWTGIWLLKQEYIPQSSEQAFEKYSRYDGLIIGLGTVSNHPKFFEYYKKCFPDKALILHLPACEMHERPDGPDVWYEILDEMTYGSCLLDEEMRVVRWWPGNVVLDMCIISIAEHYAVTIDRILEPVIEHIDALLFDNVWDHPLWRIPLAHEKRRDRRQIALDWQKGHKYMFDCVRRLLPEHVLLLGNGRWTAYGEYLNGGEYEWFPSYTIKPKWRKWEDTIGFEPYAVHRRQTQEPRFNILHINNWYLRGNEERVIASAAIAEAAVVLAQPHAPNCDAWMDIKIDRVYTHHVGWRKKCNWFECYLGRPRVVTSDFLGRDGRNYTAILNTSWRKARYPVNIETKPEYITIDRFGARIVTNG